MLCSVRFCSVLLAVVYVYKWKVFCSRCSKWKGGILYNLISVLFHLTLFEQFCSINRCIRITFYLCQNHKQINKNKSNKFLLCDAHARMPIKCVSLSHSLFFASNTELYCFFLHFSLSESLLEMWSNNKCKKRMPLNCIPFRATIVINAIM